MLTHFILERLFYLKKFENHNLRGKDKVNKERANRKSIVKN